MNDRNAYNEIYSGNSEMLHSINIDPYVSVTSFVFLSHAKRRLADVKSTGMNRRVNEQRVNNTDILFEE